MTEALLGPLALALGVSAGDCLLVTWGLPTACCPVCQTAKALQWVCARPGPLGGGEKPLPPRLGAFTGLCMGEEAAAEPQLSGLCREHPHTGPSPPLAAPAAPDADGSAKGWLCLEPTALPLCKGLRGPPQGPLSLSLAPKDSAN